MIEFFVVMSVTMLAFSVRLERPLSVIKVQKVCGEEQTCTQTVIQTFSRAVSAVIPMPMTPGIPARAFNATAAFTRRPFAQPGLQPIMRDTSPNTSGLMQPLLS